MLYCMQLRMAFLNGISYLSYGNRSRDDSQVLRSDRQHTSVNGTTPVHFGAFLKTLRLRHGVRQLQVLAHLPGWTQTTYSRVESGEVAPAFDQLAPIYAALHLAGVALTAADRQQFLTLARMRIEAKRTYQEHRTDQEWDELRLRLSRTDQDSRTDEKPASRSRHMLSSPRLVETRHLMGREDWLASVMTSLQETLPKKLVVLQGPVGIGKSSELHRIALQALSAEHAHPQVILCELPAVEQEAGSEGALDLFLGTLLAEMGSPDASTQIASREARIAYALHCLEKAARPFLLLLDNAEHLLDEQGTLAPCWEHFLQRFLRCKHRASLVLATREWPGWFEGERAFLAERFVPPLTADAGALLLQHLGLATVPVEYLRQASEVVGGIPLCLEWVASLVQEPMWLDAWEDSGDLAEQGGASVAEDELTRRLLRLLGDASLFGGPIATKLNPLLERIIEKRLSEEAYQVLCILALANVPLGKPVLKMVCPRPRLLKELSATSLLVAYPNRVQVLPMVASAVRSRLSAERIAALEAQLLDAYCHWLAEGTATDPEIGALIAELATLYLKHARLLDAAQLLIRYGWLSFNRGHAPRVALLALKSMQQLDCHATDELASGGLLLNYHLAPFLSETIDAKKRFADYQQIRSLLYAGNVRLHPPTEVYLTHHMMVYAMNELRFEEAQALLDACCERLAPLCVSSVDLQVSLLEKRAILFGTWSEYREETGDTVAASHDRAQAIDSYRRCCDLLLSHTKQVSSLQDAFLKKRLAYALNDLGYHLNRIGQHAEALQVVEQSIALKEQGYLQFGGLTASYGEKSQTLAALGRFQEALHFDEKAMAEVQRLAAAGDSLSQEEVWIYRVNRGRLSLLLGNIEAAEQLITEALPHIHARRRMYRMFAHDALGEIEEWRKTNAPRYQLDWRWIETYRQLAAFDSFGWLAPAGTFTTEEERAWERLLAQRGDETAQGELDTILARSRERELALALGEQREPRLYYPAIPLDEVHARIAAFLHLSEDIMQHEPNVIVRRFYLEAIEDQVNFLRLIEAAAQRDGLRFQDYNQRLNPDPTPDEMSYTLARLRRLLQQGLARPDTAEVSQRVWQVLSEQCELPIDLSQGQEDPPVIQERPSSPAPGAARMVSPLATKRFFEAVFRDYDYEGWQVILDPNAQGARIEQGLRAFILPADTPLAISKIRHYLSHELGGHIARCVAGERSPLGILEVNTKGSLTTEEGLAVYYDRQMAVLEGKRFDESGVWLGTLACGLARGTVSPPQTFRSLYTFFEALFLLYRLLWGTDQDVEAARKRAHHLAIARCLRTFRGVPDLEQSGLCYARDVHYLRGLQLIERAVAADETVLERLAVGVVALEQLPDLQELGIVNTHQPLRKLAATSDLEAYISSFEQAEERPAEDA